MGRPSQDGKEALPRALWGGRRAAHGPFRCLLFWTAGPALTGEDTRLRIRTIGGDGGGWEDRTCLGASVWSAPPGEWETSIRCNPAGAGAVTSPARAQLPRRRPRAEGPRGALVHRAGQRHPPMPPAQAVDLQPESPATAGSARASRHWERCRCHRRPLELCPGSAAEPQPLMEWPTFPRKGPAHGGRWVAPDERRTLPRASAWDLAPDPAGRGDPDSRREGGSWEDLSRQPREKARSSAIPEGRTQAPRGRVPAPGRT